MEDNHNLIGSLSSDLPNISLFGIYDGHGGAFTSKFISENLPRIFQNRQEIELYKELNENQQNDVEGIRLLKSACIGTFVELDDQMKELKYLHQSPISNQLANEDCSKRLRSDKYGGLYDPSGSTCVIVVITPSHIMCANAGDSRACLNRNGKVIPLSFDHKPDNHVEYHRIKKAGGTVVMKRVDGDLAVSRGLGDFVYKGRKDLPLECQKVSCIPDITVYPRNSTKDEFIVLACDGIFDVMSNQACVNKIQKLMNKGEKLRNICENVLDSCLKKRSRDNMSIIIVSFVRNKMASN